MSWRIAREGEGAILRFHSSDVPEIAILHCLQEFARARCVAARQQSRQIARTSPKSPAYPYTWTATRTTVPQLEQQRQRRRHIGVTGGREIFDDCIGHVDCAFATSQPAEKHRPGAVVAFRHFGCDRHRLRPRLRGWWNGRSRCIGRGNGRRRRPSTISPVQSVSTGPRARPMRVAVAVAVAAAPAVPELPLGALLGPVARGAAVPRADWGRPP